MLNVTPYYREISVSYFDSSNYKDKKVRLNILCWLSPYGLDMKQPPERSWSFWQSPPWLDPHPGSNVDTVRYEDFFQATSQFFFHSLLSKSFPDLSGILNLVQLYLVRWQVVVVCPSLTGEQNLPFETESSNIENFSYQLQNVDHDLYL